MSDTHGKAGNDKSMVTASEPGTVSAPAPGAPAPADSAPTAPDTTVTAPIAAADSSPVPETPPTPTIPDPRATTEMPVVEELPAPQIDQADGDKAGAPPALTSIEVTPVDATPPAPPVAETKPPAAEVVAVPAAAHETPITEAAVPLAEAAPPVAAIPVPAAEAAPPTGEAVRAADSDTGPLSPPLAEEVPPASDTTPVVDAPDVAPAAPAAAPAAEMTPATVSETPPAAASPAQPAPAPAALPSPEPPPVTASAPPAAAPVVATPPAADAVLPIAPATPQSAPAPDETYPTDGQAQPVSCPICGQRSRLGELACSYCGYVFGTAGKTHKMDDGDEEISGKKSWPTGEVLTTEQKPIIFEIEGKQLTLMIAEMVTVGRGSDIPGDIAPDVDLSAFNAANLGVSRRHIRIRRKGILLYVADLNSTNGTLLNGRRLIPEGERLIRSGDELRLGHLRIRVKF